MPRRRLAVLAAALLPAAAAHAQTATAALGMWIDQIEYRSRAGQWRDASLYVEPGRARLYRDRAGRHPLAVMEGERVVVDGAWDRSRRWIPVAAAAAATVAAAWWQLDRTRPSGGAWEVNPDYAAWEAVTPDPTAPDATAAPARRVWAPAGRGAGALATTAGLAGGGGLATWALWRRPRSRSSIVISMPGGRVILRAADRRRFQLLLSELRRSIDSGPARPPPSGLGNEALHGFAPPPPDPRARPAPAHLLR